MLKTRVHGSAECSEKIPFFCLKGELYQACVGEDVFSDSKVLFSEFATFDVFLGAFLWTKRTRAGLCN